LAGLSAGKYFKIGIAILLSSQAACIFFPQEKPLNPKLLFTVGSSFLDNAKTLALKGDIDFSDGRTAQSGKFTIFINGQDSLALLIEGPLNIDVFRMLIVDGTIEFHSGNKDWQTIDKGEQAAVEPYGIYNLQPVLTGLFVFPQYYLHSFGHEIYPGEYQFGPYDSDFTLHQEQSQKDFLMIQARAKITAIYSHRHDFENGYYPSKVKIFDPDSKWQMTLLIKKLRLNPQIPLQVWERQ
jgi:hypothetical protein